MKAANLYATAFPLICVQSVTYSKGSTEDDTLQEWMTFISVSVSVFDNSQMNFPFKFQHGSKTSNYVCVTSRLYIDVWQGGWQKKKKQPVQQVSITYCNQAIPSPFFMLPYKHSVPSCKVMGCVNSPTVVTANSSLTFPDINFSGKQVEGYLHHLQMANEFIGQQKYLSTGRPYKFQPKEYATDSNLLFQNAVTNTLNCNAATGKLYKKAFTFQQHAVVATRGPCPKAKLLVLPVAKDDETTKKGIGGNNAQVMALLWFTI
jgi:hypothetical protein